MPNITRSKPTRVTLVTGESLPELSNEFRPFSLGYDRQGNPDSQIRAFAVSIRNRSDKPVYIKESQDSDPVPIARFESYSIWETNGISRIYLKGATGAETVELRLLLAHNDFAVTDKIDAFVRAINHFLTQNKQETVLTDSETQLDVAGNVTVDDITSVSTTLDVAGNITVDDIAQGTISVDSVSGTVTVDTGTVTVDNVTGGLDVNTGTVTVDNVTGGLDVNTGSLTIDDIAQGTISVDSVSGTVTVDTGTVTVDNVTGGLDVNTGTVTVDSVTGGLDTNVQGNVTVGDITATSATLDGDITGQDRFDLDVLDRRSKEEYVFINAQSRQLESFNSTFNTYSAITYENEIYAPANNDGEVKQINFRVVNDSNGYAVEEVGFYLEIGNATVTPRALRSGKLAQKYAKENDSIQITAYYPETEIGIRYKPKEPIEFQEGDTVRLSVRTNTVLGNDIGNNTIEAEVITSERIPQ